MLLLNDGGVLLRLVQITYFVRFSSSGRHCCRNVWRWPGYWSISPGSASFRLLQFLGHLPDHLKLFALMGTGSSLTPFTLPLQF